MFKNAKKVISLLLLSLKSFHKTPFLQKMFFVLVLLLITVLLTNYWGIRKEGFNSVYNQQKVKEFRTKRHQDVYDDFYASVYDELLFSKVKNDYEIGQIIKETYPSSESRILDIGSGLGHHVSSLSVHGFKNVQGLDLSPSMVHEAERLYPSLKFSVGDAMNTMTFPGNSFTHITCLYFTLYYLQDKPKFFENCYHWLMPGGFLAVHLVEPDKFDPIMPAGDPFNLISPQNYVKERITTTIVKFDRFDYKSNFELKDAKDSDGISSPNAILNETFKEYDSGNVRKNEHELYMPAEQIILNFAKQVGFIVQAQIDLLNCQYAFQHIYILQKPN